MTEKMEEFYMILDVDNTLCVEKVQYHSYADVALEHMGDDEVQMILTEDQAIIISEELEELLSTEGI